MPDDIRHDWRSLPILDPQREAYHKQVRSFQADRVADMRRRLGIAWSVTCAALLAVIALAVALATVLPLQRLVPIYLVVNSDGTVDSDVSLAGLPPAAEQRMIQAAIWRYVEERQSYSFADARRRYDLISLMSAETVREAYQHWFLSDPTSPQKTVGKEGQVDVEEIGMSVIRDGVVLVRFWQTTMYQIAQKTHKESMSATVQYELASNVPGKYLRENPVGLQVVRYQVEENTP